MNINLALPEELQLHVDNQLRSGTYGTMLDYLVALIRQDQQRKLAQQKLVGLLTEGLESAAEPVTAEYWKDLRSSVLGQDS